MLSEALHDADWEYPGYQGQGDNVVKYVPSRRPCETCMFNSPDPFPSANDTANLLLFLQTLRQVAGQDARLSMDVSVVGMVGAEGETLTDLKGFAKVLDCESMKLHAVVWG
jgi:GH18 family chitinase